MPVPGNVLAMREGPRIGVVLGLAVLLVVVVLGAVQIAQRVHGDPKPPVAIIGDSITALGRDQIGRTLGPSYSLAVDGHSGYRVAEQLPAATRLAERHPEQVVINLGTNDVGTEVPTEQAAASLAEMVALFPDARCIHLVTINESMGIPTLAVGPERAAALNGRIRALAASDPRLRIVDWAQIVRDYEAVHGPGSATSDTVHPTLGAQQALVDAYRASLDSCPPADQALAVLRTGASGEPAMGPR